MLGLPRLIMAAACREVIPALGIDSGRVTGNSELIHTDEKRGCCERGSQVTLQTGIYTHDPSMSEIAMLRQQCGVLLVCSKAAARRLG